MITKIDDFRKINESGYIHPTYLFWYDMINCQFLNKKQLGPVNMDDVKTLDILQIKVEEPSAYYFKWSFEHKGIMLTNNGGSIQGFVKDVANFINKLSGKDLPIKEQDKLYHLYKYFKSDN